MTINTFGIDVASVFQDHFPTWDAPSASSSPNSTRVDEWISQESAVIAGHLLNADVNPDEIDASSAAYYWCAKVVRQLVAVRVARVLSGANPALAEAWAKDAADSLAMLATQGAGAMGDPALEPDGGDSPNNGPFSHISVNRLTQDAAEDMSDVVPQFRRSDIL